MNLRVSPQPSSFLTKCKASSYISSSVLEDQNTPVKLCLNDLDKPDTIFGFDKLDTTFGFALVKANGWNATHEREYGSAGPISAERFNLIQKVMWQRFKVPTR